MLSIRLMQTSIDVGKSFQEGDLVMTYLRHNHLLGIHTKLGK